MSTLNLHASSGHLTSSLLVSLLHLLVSPLLYSLVLSCFFGESDIVCDPLVTGASREPGICDG